MQGPCDAYDRYLNLDRIPVHVGKTLHRRTRPPPAYTGKAAACVAL